MPAWPGRSCSVSTHAAGSCSAVHAMVLRTTRARAYALRCRRRRCNARAVCRNCQLAPLPAPVGPQVWSATLSADSFASRNIYNLRVRRALPPTLRGCAFALAPLPARLDPQAVHSVLQAA